MKARNYNCICEICGTPVDGRRRIGDDVYCQTHFDMESAQEKSMNDFINKKEKQFKKHFDTTR